MLLGGLPDLEKILIRPYFFEDVETMCTTEEKWYDLNVSWFRLTTNRSSNATISLYHSIYTTDTQHREKIEKNTKLKKRQNEGLKIR